MFHALQRFDARLARLEGVVLVFILTVVISLGLLQVLWRNLLAGGLFWADEFLQHLVLWLGFLGASLATRAQRHLYIDLFVRLTPERWRRPLRLVVHSAALLVCVLLTQAAWTFVRSEYAAGTVLTCGVPTWTAQSIIPLGFMTMAWRFALHGWASARQRAAPQGHG